MNYYPIVLFCYNRPLHLQHCLDSLKQSTLLKKSDLFIFCDGPKNIFDKRKTDQVKKIANTFTGSKSLKVFQNKANQGLANSVIHGVSQLLDKFPAVIVLEDDLLLHPQFLSFMNQSLKTYQTDSRIFSVTGYTLPKWRFSIPKGYPHQIYLAPRVSSWGWGTWRDRWKSVEWQLDREDLNKQCHGNSIATEMLKSGGEDLIMILELYLKKKVDSWAIRFNWAQAIQNKVSLHPVSTLVLNQGMDGSGIHARLHWLHRDSFTYPLNEIPPTPAKIEIDQEVLAQFKEAYRPRFFWKIIDFVEQIFRKYDVPL